MLICWISQMHQQITLSAYFGIHHTYGETLLIANNYQLPTVATRQANKQITHSLIYQHSVFGYSEIFRYFGNK